MNLPARREAWMRRWRLVTTLGKPIILRHQGRWYLFDKPGFGGGSATFARLTGPPRFDRLGSDAPDS